MTYNLLFETYLLGITFNFRLNLNWEWT